MGLREADAAQARRRWGPNELPPDPGTPFWKLVLKQFDDLLVKILIAAAAVSLLIGLADGEGWSSLVEPGVIVLILVANATVGVLTETNAERAIEELKAYQADVAAVFREGRLRNVPAAELVPGHSRHPRVDQQQIDGSSGRGETPKAVERRGRARVRLDPRPPTLDFSLNAVEVLRMIIHQRNAAPLELRRTRYFGPLHETDP